jgi:ZIP family zinc transporter
MAVDATMFQEALVPLALTLLAGLSTGIGSAIALLVKRVHPGFLRLMLGFSAGVMLYVSFTELLGAGIEELGFIGGNIAFFLGIAFIAGIDFFVPHEFLAERLPKPKGGGHSRVLRAGLLTAFGMMIHNFPEGMAVFASALQDPQLGLSLAVAIGIHNIPEGIAVSMPIYSATGNRWYAFRVSFLSGLAEPLGAIIAGLWLLPFLTPQVMGGLLAAVGGLMTFISFDEILPISYHREESNGALTLAHEAIIGIIAGMFVMAISLALF